YLPFPENYWIFPGGLTDYKYRFMMFCGSFLFAFASIFVITLKETNVFKQKNKLRLFKKILQNKSFTVLTTVTLVWWFVMSFLWPLGPYVLKRLDPSSAEVAILSAVFSASMALAQISARKIVNKIGRKMTIVVGLASLILVPIVLAFSSYWYIIIIANIFGGYGNGTIMVAISAEILDMADPETRGAYTGVYNLMMGIATFCGSFLCGILFGYFTNGMEYMDNSFFMILRIFLISITVIRLVAAIPILIYALKSRKS
ncbi:MAG: MFS transporter, partial [Candidatus Heimdallarchaeota archaeon]|nr:MFS transporter [Candidatus Heimdallarchaeota archaeon]